MHRFGSFVHKLERESVLGMRLIIAWFAGLSMGFCAVRFFGDTYVSLISQAAGTPSSAAFVFITVFPLFLSAFAAMILPSFFQYGICLLRGLMLTLPLGAICQVFPNGTLLAAILLLFSSLAFSPVLLWFWWRRLCIGRNRLSHDAWLCATIGGLIAWVDLWFIAPFLADVVML